MRDVTSPNCEDENGPFWDPWEALGIRCCSYSGQNDIDAVLVLEGIQRHQFNTDIAHDTGMSPSHVELLQGIFCTANWAEYGTSPRGCWPSYHVDFGAIIDGWKAYYERHWEEPFPAQGMSASGQDPQGLEAKPASPVAEGDAPQTSEDNHGQ